MDKCLTGLNAYHTRKINEIILGMLGVDSETIKREVTRMSDGKVHHLDNVDNFVREQAMYQYAKQLYAKRAELAWEVHQAGGRIRVPYGQTDMFLSPEVIVEQETAAKDKTLHRQMLYEMQLANRRKEIQDQITAAKEQKQQEILGEKLELDPFVIAARALEAANRPNSDKILPPAKSQANKEQDAALEEIGRTIEMASTKLQKIKDDRIAAIGTKSKRNFEAESARVHKVLIRAQRKRKELIRTKEVVNRKSNWDNLVKAHNVFMNDYTSDSIVEGTAKQRQKRSKLYAARQKKKEQEASRTYKEYIEDRLARENAELEADHKFTGFADTFGYSERLQQLRDEKKSKNEPKYPDKTSAPLDTASTVNEAALIRADLREQHVAAAKENNKTLLADLEAQLKALDIEQAAYEANKASIQKEKDRLKDIAATREQVQEFISEEDAPFSSALLSSEALRNNSQVNDTVSEEQTKTYAQTVLNAVAKMFNLQPATYVSLEEAIALHEELGHTKSVAQLKTGTKRGQFITRHNADGTKDYFVYVKAGMDPDLTAFVVRHELGHQIIATHFDKASRATQRAIENAYKLWLKKMGKSGTTIKDSMWSRSDGVGTFEALMHAFGQEQYMGDLDPDAVNDFNSFQEWAADMLAVQLKQEIRPRGKVAQFFHDMAKALARLFGKDQLGVFLDSVSGKDNGFIRGLHKNETFQSISKELQKMGESPFFSTIGTLGVKLMDKDFQTRVSNNIGMQKLADLMFKSRGDKREDISYVVGKTLKIGEFEALAVSVFKGVSPEQKADIRRYAYNRTKIEDVPEALRSKVQALRDLYKQIDSYRNDYKKVPDSQSAIENFAPQIVDVERMDKYKDDILEMFAKPEYEEAMKDIAKQLKLVYTNEDVYMPQVIFDHLVGNRGVDDLGKLEFASGSEFLNKPLMQFLNQEDSAYWKENVLYEDIEEATYVYASHTVKHKEFVDRFGKASPADIQATMNTLKRIAKTVTTTRGKAQINTFQQTLLGHITEPKGITKVDLLIYEARADGATERDIEVMQNSLAAETGTYGAHTATWLNKTFGIPMPAEGGSINSGLQATQAVMMMTSNVMVLGLSTLTSLVDPLGIAVRTGSFTHAFNGFRVGLSSVYGNNPTAALAAANLIGIISPNLTREALQHEYANAILPKAFKKFNDGFFKVIGLEQWTRSTRIMAVHAGLEIFKEGTDKALLETLGLKDGDIVLNKDGSLKLLSNDELTGVTDEERARDQTVKRALVEFVDECVLRPGPSHKPIFGSNPHFALVMHLKSFAYAFQKMMIGPAIREMRYHNNHKPLLALLSYIPAMTAVGVLKDIVKYGTAFPEHKANWGITDYLLDGTEKSGLLGMFEPVVGSLVGGGEGLGYSSFVSPSLSPVSTYGDLPIPIRYWF